MRTEHHAQSVREGVVGAAGALATFVTPFLRGVRSRWGLALEEAQRAYPGDELVPKPSWMWTHGVDIDASAASVWPWVVQIGQNKAGFYSYEWLENLVGCEIRNADSIHPAWQSLQVGDPLRLHPKVPPLAVAAIDPGRWFVVTSDIDSGAVAEGIPDAHVSWLFYVEPLGPKKSRFISRFRLAHASGVRGSLNYGAWINESIGFVMDRAMLLGVKRRAERRQ